MGKYKLNRDKLFSSINKLTLRKKIKKILIEIAVEIEESWVDQVMNLVQENNRLKKQLRSKNVRPK